jgi:hypothetical protein
MITRERTLFVSSNQVPLAQAGLKTQHWEPIPPDMAWVLDLAPDTDAMHDALVNETNEIKRMCLICGDILQLADASQANTCSKVLTGCRVSLIQDISEADAIEAGFSSVAAFSADWDARVDANLSWASNPYAIGSMFGTGSSSSSSAP